LNLGLGLGTELSKSKDTALKDLWDALDHLDLTGRVQHQRRGKREEQKAKAHGREGADAQWLTS
jgi:hypothetical protein